MFHRGTLWGQVLLNFENDPGVAGDFPVGIIFIRWFHRWVFYITGVEATMSAGRIFPTKSGGSSSWCVLTTVIKYCLLICGKHRRWQTRHTKIERRTLSHGKQMNGRHRARHRWKYLYNLWDLPWLRVSFALLVHFVDHIFTYRYINLYRLQLITGTQ